MSWLGRDVAHYTTGHEDAPPPVRQNPSPRPHLVQHLDECDCGRAHPVGFICASTYKDRA